MQSKPADTNNYDHILQQLRTLLGDVFFANHPNLQWRTQPGNDQEGTMLTLSNKYFPADSLDWYRKRLDGKIKYKFVDRQSGKKQLFILDIYGDVTLRHLQHQNRTMPLQDQQRFNQLFFSAPSSEAGKQRVIDQAANPFVEVIEADIAKEAGITFTHDMRAECKRRVIEVFNQLYSSTTMHNIHSAQALMIYFEPVKEAIIKNYLSEQNDNSSMSNSP